MKQAFIKVIILTGLLFMLSYNMCLANDWDVRPVKLKVIDAVTKQPLSGIKVYYVLVSGEPSMGCFSALFWFYDMPINYKIEYKEELPTDINGEVQFAAKTFDMSCYQRIDVEKIIINLDFPDSELLPAIYKDKYDFLRSWIYWTRGKIVFNPNPNYKGCYLIYDTKFPDHEERLVKDADYKDNYEKIILKKFDHQRRATDWDGPPEEYTVELRRADN